MSFDVLIQRDAHFMRVKVAGHPSLDQLLSLFHLLAVESETWVHNTLLVDLRRVESQFTEAEQAEVGREVAASLAHLRRIASVVPTHRLTRISERAAKQNGMDVCVFDVEDDAIDWLAATA
ncbi:STAS/SEC14 domain-containing protein [Caenimonas sedimenti]|uniref:STAS/SEC14 domain-containing protein n=1 Tax=Caenimonas sedimenti TaxID=2596921 RepID=A0A562ZWY2_9BURK|nr:STAS/SEC14 domain-containing protein [Caenimonas sedimenti]TWO73119.1 STAS/SEC14 domain-containing protein [Caenimonas sedimenti]